MSDKRLEPCFLGPYGENNELFEKILVEFIRDHVYWRRNFHPEDPPVISTLAAYQPHYEEFVGRMRRELHVLSAQLKRSVPFFSPRYIGHMASDLLLPALLGQMITLPYNPNNVVDEAAPITLDIELDVGLQLARMIGYCADEERVDCAFGYLTSGGTVANYQALRSLLAIKLYPLAVRSGCVAEGFEFEWNGNPIAEASEWELLNLSVDEVISLRSGLVALGRSDEEPARLRSLLRAIRRERVEHLGLVEFWERHPDCGPLSVFVPITAHYSWQKAMKLIGLGTSHLGIIPEVGMRMDCDALNHELARCAKERRPVLAVVGVLGTTEFGTLDPIHSIVEAREHWAGKGLGFGVHVDAAWGGYLATLLREPDGGLRSHDSVREQFHYFPSEEVYDSIVGMAASDCVTVDPHKLGYVPFGAGAFLCRDQRMMDFAVQDAAYVFDPRTDKDDYRTKFRALGKFIMEGSKPGAAAAAVWVTHRTLPLDHEHFGLLPATTIRAAEHFWDLIAELSESLSDVAHLIVPFEPDTNLICLTFNPVGNRSLAVMNRFVQAVFEDLRVDRERPLQVKQFFGSTTRLYPGSLGEKETEQILRALGINPHSLTEDPVDVNCEADSLLILRHTLMNPWLVDEQNDTDYIAGYCSFLERLIRSKAAIL